MRRRLTALPWLRRRPDRPSRAVVARHPSAGPNTTSRRRSSAIVMESVRHAGSDEHHVAGARRRLLVPDGEAAPAGDHVVDLVLGVRPLAVDAAGRQHVEPGAQVGRPLELEVRLGPRAAIQLLAQRRVRGSPLARPPSRDGDRRYDAVAPMARQVRTRLHRSRSSSRPSCCGACGSSGHAIADGVRARVRRRARHRPPRRRPAREHRRAERRPRDTRRHRDGRSRAAPGAARDRPHLASAPTVTPARAPPRPRSRSARWSSGLSAPDRHRQRARRVRPALRRANRAA